MDLELKRRAFEFIRDFAPVEEQKGSSIKATIAFCSTIFVTISSEDIRLAAEEAWQRHIEENGKYRDRWRVFNG